MFILGMSHKIITSYFLPFFILSLLIIQNIPAKSGTVQQEYTLKPGDSIDITVEGYPEYSKQISIRIDGMISYPIVGELKAAGKTISVLEQEIRKKLSAQLGPLKAYVILIRSKQNSIYVLGSVKMPNRYFFESEEIYLLQALSMAGGVDYEKADFKHVQIRRDGKVEKIIDLKKLINDKERQDVGLNPYDVVFVPNRLKQKPIYVTGAVLKQGSYYVEDENVHVLKALRIAGGPEQDVANLKDAIIIRTNGVMSEVNIEKIEKEGSSSGTSVLMNPGDILHIPNAYEEEKVTVIGEVQKPGQYFVKRPINVIEALSLGGGWRSDTANLKEALLIREDGTRTEINLFEVIENKENAEKIILYPGDTLQVPQKFQINWSALLTVTSVISLIYNMFR